MSTKSLRNVSVSNASRGQISITTTAFLQNEEIIKTSDDRDQLLHNNAMVEHKIRQSNQARKVKTFYGSSKDHSLCEQCTTHNVKEAMRSVLVKFNPALYLVKFPVAVSKERSAPRDKSLLPATPEKLTMGVAVNPILVLMPA